MSDSVLIIAYGNPLRSEDGIAWRVAEEISRTSSAATTLCVHQLTPELAKDISRPSAVIFIDSSCDGAPGEVRCNAVYADRSSENFSHSLAPDQLLSICKQLYESEPCGFLVSIAGECFDHGEILSASVMSALPQAVAAVKKLLERRSLLQA